MFGVGVPESLVLVLPALGLVAAYWVIRLGVRHGVADADAAVPEMRHRVDRTDRAH